MSTESFVGLDVPMRPGGEPWRVANDEAGIAQRTKCASGLKTPGRCGRGLGARCPLSAAPDSRAAPQLASDPWG